MLLVITTHKKHIDPLAMHAWTLVSVNESVASQWEKHDGSGSVPVSSVTSEGSVIFPQWGFDDKTFSPILFQQYSPDLLLRPGY